jgi:hypothetical protein
MHRYDAVFTIEVALYESFAAYIFPATVIHFARAL